MAKSFLLPFVTSCLFVSACSNSQAPKNLQVHCGPSIPSDDVMVLDMRDKAREGILDYDYVEEHAGPFQLFTEQPVGVQKNRPYSTEPIPRGTSGAKSHAAVRGCDLLLLLGDNIPNRSTVRSTWLVHLGKRQR